MSQPTPDREHFDELRADRALFGLSEADARELAVLGAPDSDAMPDEFELTAAALDLSRQGERGEGELPAHLKARILAASKNPPVVALPEARTTGAAPRRRELIAWLATAAALLVAFFLAVRPSGDDAPSPAALRNQLLALRSDEQAQVVELEWTRGEDATAAAAAGDVVWSGREQAGVMRFRGLAANDPAVNQYQLWIFDAERDERYPVDGGVFDVPAGVDEVLVPIRARLPVARATLFAITVERPGGVVVSDRSRLPLLAQVP